MLGWPRGTVKSRLHRALRALEAAMASRENMAPGRRCGVVADSLDVLVADLVSLGRSVPAAAPDDRLAATVVSRVSGRAGPGRRGRDVA